MLVSKNKAISLQHQRTSHALRFFVLILKYTCIDFWVSVKKSLAQMDPFLQDQEEGVFVDIILS
jgi:hypothetical protein